MAPTLYYWHRPNLLLAPLYVSLAPTLPLRHPCRCSDTLEQSSPRMANQNFGKILSYKSFKQLVLDVQEGPQLSKNPNVQKKRPQTVKRPKPQMSKMGPKRKKKRTYCTLYHLVILSQQTMVPITVVVVVDVIAVVWWFRRGLCGRGSFCRCCRLCCCCRGPLCGCWRSWSSGCCGCWWIRWLRRWYW